MCTSRTTRPSETSAVNNREAARLISASTPFAGKALDVRVDGTYATALSDALQDELQRKLGLWLSVALPTLRVALERGLSPGVEVSRPGVEGVELLSRDRGVEPAVEGCRGLVSRCRGQGSGTTLYGKNRTPPTDERSRNRSAAGGARQGRARDRARSPFL